MAPIVAGIVADTVGFGTNFLIPAAILLAGIACFLLLPGHIEQIEAPTTGKSRISETRDRTAA